MEKEKQENTWHQRLKQTALIQEGWRLPELINNRGVAPALEPARTGRPAWASAGTRGISELLFAAREGGSGRRRLG